ncbi:MAG: 2-oxo acid dehydrogenase subunit E2 [Candidatus Sumerlaeaceae bacterium]|nr:2-oxo acid dehydrogenase subunit E2 [Candidatus Sumerlaeaceae bacterium]
MAIEVKLPRLADGVESGDVLNVLVKEGDVVQPEDPLVELESEKATLPVPSPAAGRVVKIYVQSGTKVKVGDILVVLEELSTNGEGPAAQTDSDYVATPAQLTDDDANESNPEGPATLIEVKLPQLADGVETGDVLNVLVKEGDVIQADDPVVELESEKATVAIPTPVGGKVVKVLIKAGDKVRVGETMIIVDSGKGEKTETSAETVAGSTGGGESPTTVETAQATPTVVSGVAEPHRQAVQPLAPAVTTDEDFIPASPAVRRIAREIGLDLRRVKGSGKNGRILIEDLDPYIQEFVQKRGAALVGAPMAQAVELPDFAQWGPIRRVKIEPIRRKISEHLSQAWLTIPHVHQFHEADISELLALQKRHRERVKQRGAALTLTPFIMKAVVIALKEYPEFNASFDVRNEEIIYKDYYHLGLAVDTPAGLIVPVIRDVDKKTIVELALELADVAERTRQRKVSLEELRGSTFTISNLGSIGGGHFTPIVNSPEVAILGVGRAAKRLVLNNGQVEERAFLPLCVGYDHRVIDGAQGARFIVRVAEVLENFEATFLGF